MRRCISLCVVLVTLLAASSLVSAGGWEDDEVFIVSCCATGEIPMNSEPESACTQAFCDKVTNNQATAFKEFEKKIEKEENEATKDGFAESHRKGEGHDMKGVYLRELKGKTNIRTKLPKYTGSLVKPPPRKASLLQFQTSVMARQAKLLRRINSATSSANTYVAANLHPQGRIKFKWTGNLAGPITPMSDPVKTVLFWYVNAMKQWEKNTCIWFEESDAGTVSFTDSQHGSSSNGLGTASTLVKVEQPFHGTARTRACAEHELGHTIGFDHTNKRTDAFHNPADAVNDYITFDTNACVNDFYGYCDSTPAELADGFVQAYCADNSQAAQVGAWADQYYGHAGFVYDFATPGFKDYCERLVCVVGWIYQYEQSATLADTGAYEFGSIMHYPFDNCIKKNAAKSDAFGNKAPGKNKVTDNDRALLNNVYGCVDLTVNWATTKPAKTVKVHPKLPASDLKAYLSKKLGWNDAFTLKKTADSAPVTGGNAIGNLGAVDLVPKFQI